MATLQSLVPSKVLSAEMANKYLSLGLKFDRFNLAYVKNDTEGLRSMLLEKFRGVVRVTKSKKIINALREHFKKSNLFVLLSLESSFMCSYHGLWLLWALLLEILYVLTPGHKMLLLIF